MFTAAITTNVLTSGAIQTLASEGVMNPARGGAVGLTSCFGSRDFCCATADTTKQTAIRDAKNTLTIGLKITARRKDGQETLPRWVRVNFRAIPPTAVG